MDNIWVMLSPWSGWLDQGSSLNCLEGGEERQRNWGQNEHQSFHFLIFFDFHMLMFYIYVYVYHFIYKIIKIPCIAMVSFFTLHCLQYYKKIAVVDKGLACRSVQIRAKQHRVEQKRSKQCREMQTCAEKEKKITNKWRIVQKTARQGKAVPHTA